MQVDSALQQRYSSLLPQLNERQRRLCVAADARYFGYGGITKVSLASGISRVTIHKGLKELVKKSFLEGFEGRSRKCGGGRKKIKEKCPGIVGCLEKIVDPEARGDPESPLKWTTKSLRNLAQELKKKGYQISHRVVGNLLRDLEYSLQANVKTSEGKIHKDRDLQFTYIKDLSKDFFNKNDPVISVDTKKREIVGRFKNNGYEWRPKGKPEKVNIYDFPSLSKGKAIPYGVYDIANNEGWINVGITHDTAEFAVESIRAWWKGMGKLKYKKAKGLLITADSGGSNGARTRLWKKELQRFANEEGLEITVCHFPSGTSKWNKIEHRLFSFITKNWRGRPLISYKVIINLISSTKTKNGLKVKAVLDTNEYPTKIKVTDKEMKEINLKRHEFHGEWNYTISPQEFVKK